MTHQTTLLSLLLSGALAGCASSSGEMRDQANTAAAATADSFASAWSSVKSGARETARFGGYVIDRTESGAVRAYRVAREKVRGGQGSTESLSDAYLSGKVKSRLDQDPNVQAGRIRVEADAGVVTLDGSVPDERQAAEAVRDALDVHGVYAVNSQLHSPSRNAARGGGTM